MDNTERRKLIEDSVASHAGFQILAWEKDEEEGEGRERAILGRFVVLEDADPTMGPFEGEEGTLVASVVGSTKYNNVRVHFGFIADGTDAPNEIDIYTLEEI